LNTGPAAIFEAQSTWSIIGWDSLVWYKSNRNVGDEARFAFDSTLRLSISKYAMALCFIMSDFGYVEGFFEHLSVNDRDACVEGLKLLSDLSKHSHFRDNDCTSCMASVAFLSSYLDDDDKQIKTIALRIFYEIGMRIDHQALIRHIGQSKLKGLVENWSQYCRGNDSTPLVNEAMKTGGLLMSMGVLTPTEQGRESLYFTWLVPAIYIIYGNESGSVGLQFQNIPSRVLSDKFPRSTRIEKQLSLD
jgi:hypothetical protein